MIFKTFIKLLCPPIRACTRAQFWDLGYQLSSPTELLPVSVAWGEKATVLDVKVVGSIPVLGGGEGVVWSLHRSVTFNQLRALASSCNPATWELPMLEIYDLGVHSHLFQPILKQIPTSPKIVGIRTGYPHVLISTPCYLDCFVQF